VKSLQQCFHLKRLLSFQSMTSENLCEPSPILAPLGEILCEPRRLWRRGSRAPAYVSTPSDLLSGWPPGKEGRKGKSPKGSKERGKWGEWNGKGTMEEGNGREQSGTKRRGSVFASVKINSWVAYSPDNLPYTLWFRTVCCLFS